MKRSVLSLFAILLFSLGVSAQVEINPGSIVLEADNEDKIFMEIAITNNSSEPVDIYWRYQPDANYPTNWKTQLCDLNLCYVWDGFESNPNLPNVIGAGEEVIFTLKVDNNLDESLPVSGSSCGVLTLFGDSDKTDILASTLCSTSTTELELDDIVIYPNPTTESFQLKNDASVASISIHNIVGRLVSTFNHSEGMIHDVNNLRSGMYLIRLENKDGEVLKSMRLSKR